MDDQLWKLGAVDTAKAIRDGKFSCRDSVSAAVDRMREVNSSVNGVTVDLGDQALAEAEQADQVLRSGGIAGPLHGVPVTIKENIDVTGQATTNGLDAFSDLVAEEDSPVVTNLKNAGAIIIGRTNTPEFSLRWFTDNPLRGLTRNPWHADITPGGSSGGASASVALGIGAIAHGNDLGGSLRYPAYACGLATIKPGLGRVPAYNSTAPAERSPMLQLMSVQGPICREVKDVKLALEVMAAGSVQDPWYAPVPLEFGNNNSPVSVAVTTGSDFLDCHPVVRQAVDDAAGILDDAGYRVSQIDPPNLPEIAERWRSLICADVRAMTLDAIRQYGNEDINAVIDGYFTASPRLDDVKAYTTALADRTRLIRDWAQFSENYPLVLAPVSQVPPFPQNEDLKGSDRVSKILEQQSLLYSVNLLGLPSAAVATGLARGLPTGVQIIGRRYCEFQCLDAAQHIENRTGILSRQLWDRS